MSNPLRILILDDVESDAELMENELSKVKLNFITKKVDNRDDFIKEINHFSPGLIISDYNILKFNGIEALKKVKKISPDIPFLMVMDPMDEQIAIDCKKAGAWDYISKQKLDELGPAVKNILYPKNKKKKKIKTEITPAEDLSLYQAIIGSLRETIIVVYDQDGNHKYVLASPELDERYGIKCKNLTGQSLAVLYSPADAIERINDIKHVFETGNPIRNETLTQFPNGPFRHDLTLTPMKNKNGDITGVVGFLLDITKRKNVEQERTSLVTAIEQLAESIVITDTNANIIYVNPAIEKVTKYKRDELINQNCRLFNSGKHDLEFYKNMWETIMSGQIWANQIINKKKDGSLFEEKITISPIKDKNGTIIHFVAIKKDITNEKRLERQLIQAQKMEAIGTLAGGIAHDFNNILAAILGFTEISLRNTTENPRLQRNLGYVLQAGYRAKDLIKQILAFSRLNQQEKKPLQISLIIKEALKLLRASLPATIEIQQKIAAKSSIVMADPTQIHQVLMNLCTNAAHSMRDTGGILKIALYDVNISSEDIVHYHGIKPGPYVKFTVSDTGCGISPEIIEKIFDPYFTTKKPGEGTGMGLSVVHGIIKSHHGEIVVYSEKNKGTSFHILLPRLETDTKKEEEQLTPLPHGNEKILFVDDEKSLVNIGKEMLEQLGYKVVGKTNSLKALKVFSELPGEFDLIITDQTMPHLTGADFAKKVFLIRPDIPIILCTGFSEVISEEKAKSIGIREYIMKPIFMKEIAYVVRRLLDAKNRGE